MNYYDDPRDTMDLTDIGGDAGGAVFPVFGFSGMAKDDEAILQIREEGMVYDLFLRLDRFDLLSVDC